MTNFASKIDDDMENSSYKSGRTVRLATCPNSYEANILKLELENNGIGCILGNEAMSTFLGGLLPVLGVDVYVFEQDGDKAADIYRKLFIETEPET